MRVVERSHDFGFGFEAEVVGGRGAVAGDFDDALFGGVDASGEPELGHAAGAEEPEDFPAVDGGWEEGRGGVLGRGVMEGAFERATGAGEADPFDVSGGS